VIVTLLSILAAVLAVSLLIVLHEAGHMWVARRLGMRVDRFSVGFGPVVWSRRIGETEYVVSALPLGGYVRIVGMAPGDDVKEGDLTAYCNQPVWRRILVLLAGPGANYLTAVALAVLLLGTVGLPTPDGSSRVGNLQPGRPAERAGLKFGDRITAVAGTKVEHWTDLVEQIEKHPGETIDVVVERGEGPSPEQLTLSVTPDDRSGKGKVGFEPFAPPVRLPAGQALAQGVSLTNLQFGRTVSLLVGMVRREQKAEFSGPVGIAQELVRGAKVGLDRFLTIVWNISVALALFNLLPVPALDGGRLIFLGIEAVTRRRVSEKVESYAHAAGFVALIALLLGVTIFGDLARLFGR
jgi:regulator of sigma E protease